MDAFTNLRQVERLLFGLGEARFDLKAVGFQRNWSCHVIARHTLQLAIEPDGSLHACERTLGLQNSVVSVADRSLPLLDLVEMLCQPRA